MKRWAAELAPITDVDVRYHEATEKNFIRDFGNFDLLDLKWSDFPDSAQLTARFLTSATTPNLTTRIEGFYVDYCRVSLRWRMTEREFAQISSQLEEEFPTSALKQSNRRRYDTLCAQQVSLRLRKLDLRTSSLTLHGIIVLLLQIMSSRMAPQVKKDDATVSAATGNGQPAVNTARTRSSLPSFDLEVEFMV